jgi:hypothetical protein
VLKTLARGRDRDEIFTRLRPLRPDSARRWGRMTAHQMVCHLSDSFAMLTGEKTASPASGPLQRTVVKWIALYVPLAWPAGIRTRPEVDQHVAGTPPAEFAGDLARLEARIAACCAASTRLEGRAHPIFGPLSRAAWLRWGYLHADHHLRQFGG